jgi:UTP--glucose-1-phosphate uridylyltransferase
MEDITKVIIPAAGQGTRFLPFTKAIPKEMLPLLEKPALQRIVEEGIQSEIRNYIIITARGKNSIEDHFDANPVLESFLKEHEKESLVNCIEKIIKLAEFTYVRQQEPLGLGHAVWLARHSIQKEYFGIMLPDDIIISKQPALDQLIRIARQEKASVIAVQEVPIDCVSSYGIISVKKQLTPHLFQIGSVIEKPSQKNAPSNLAIIGRYVLSNKIFSSLEQMKNYSVGELQLTDGIAHMIQNNEKVFAYKIQGVRYDLGTPVGWIKAIISLSLQHPQYQASIKRYISELGTIDSALYNQSKNIEHSL